VPRRPLRRGPRRHRRADPRRTLLLARRRRLARVGGHSFCQPPQCHVCVPPRAAGARGGALRLR
jgi:hypothetical protein